MSGDLPQSAKPSEETVFVVGNGPSLKEFDLTDLKNMPWVGMNSAYRHWDRIYQYPTYYACLDLVVGLSHQSAIERLVRESDALGISSFLLRENLISNSKILKSSIKVTNFDKKFKDLPHRVGELVTTGSHALLWMIDLGFEQVVLLGIDANYEERVAGAVPVKDVTLRIEQSGDNPNYYFEDYQREGDHYSLPNPQAGVHSGAWRRCAQYVKQIKPSARIFNASKVSEIDCFPFILIHDFLGQGSEITPVEERLHKRLSREVKIAGDISSFNLAAFIDHLCPPYIGQFEHKSLEAPDVSALKHQGWSKLSASKPDYKRALVSFSGTVPDPSAACITHYETPETAMEIASDLLGYNDSVFVLSGEGNEVTLRRFPCHIEKAGGYIIAFQSIRFWTKQIEKALKLAVAEPGQTVSKRRRWERKFRTLFSKVRR